MGHPPDAVWTYTPKQISGFLWFAEKRRKVEAAQQLSIGHAANHGDPKEVKRLVNDWSR